MAETRNYRFTYNTGCSEKHDVIDAYDLQEAMIQFQVKYGTSVSVTEIIPFKYIEEQKPEQKKEVHVKPLPKMYLKDIPEVQEPFEGDIIQVRTPSSRDWFDSGGNGKD